MKKATAWLLALIMCLTLAACGEKPVDTTAAPQPSQNGGQTQAQTEAEKEPEGTLHINVWTAQGGDGLVMLQDAAKAFSEASNGKYEVELINAGSYNEILLKILTATQNDMPDIFASSGNNVAAILATEDSKYQIFVPVQDFADADGYSMDNILGHLRTNYQKDGKWQCIPLGNTSTGHFVNNDLLKQYGIDVKTLNSYEEILEACDKIAAQGRKENIYWIRHDYVDYLTYGLTAQGINYFDMDNGREGVPTKSLFDDGGDCQRATTAYFRFVQEMAKRGYLYDYSAGASAAREAFGNGEMIFYDGYASGANSVIKLVDNKFEMVYRVSPTMEKGVESKGQAPGGGCLFLGNTGDKWREKGAWEFMKYLMEDEQVVNYAMTTGYIPTTKTGAASEKYQEHVRTKFPSAQDIIDAQNATPLGVAYARVPFCSDFEAEFLAIEAKVVSDFDYTPEQATADLAAATDEVIMLYRAEHRN